MKFESINILKIFLSFSKEKKFLVGRLAFENQQILFEYDKEFLKTNFEISPIKLPLQINAISSNEDTFDGLYGVFNDSLPDAWGRLLLDRKLRHIKIEPSTITPLDRLSLIGEHGFGALCYQPEQDFDLSNITGLDINLDNLYQDSIKILEGSSESIDELISFSGSVGGARPKVTILLSKDRKKILHPKNFQSTENIYEPWLVKFSAKQDFEDLGLIEYAYSLMAKQAGVEMTDTHLFTTKKSAYFATKRFDRDHNKRLHVHSVSGLLHADHRYPSLDYENLLKTALILTKDINEVSKFYKIAVFNVFAHNRDDHSKNFSFLMDENGIWKAAPAYDLTYSNGPGGEHSMMICGEGKNPGIKELTELAKKFDIKNHQEIIENTKEVISQWQNIAKNLGISKSSIKLIGDKINKNA